jgi:SAM-dependent methyltransferase
MSETEWWSEFFSKVWPKVQADGYLPERTASECDLMSRLLELQPGARVLDVPCGTGRHAVELARRGFQLTGVDFNPDFVDLARAAGRNSGASPTFVVSDMREFTTPSSFDAAFCYFGSFGYFLDDGDARYLRAIARALRPGGRFLIDTHLVETLLPVFREREWFWADPPKNSRRVVEERTWNVRTSRVDVLWSIYDHTGTESANTSIRIYTLAELRALLEATGFERVEGYDGRTGGALRVGAPRAAVVASRRKA